MILFHVPNSSMNCFVGILSAYMFFLLNVVIVWVNEKFQKLLMRVRIVKPKFFQNIGIFMVNALMRHGVYLSCLLGIPLSLRRLVLFFYILFLNSMHFVLDFIIPLFRVTCVVLQTMILIHVLFMYAMLNLINPFLLTQCTGFDVGEPFKLIAMFDVGAVYCESEDTLLWSIIYLRLLWRYPVMYRCLRILLALVVKMFSPIPLINPIFLLCVHNPYFPPSLILMCQLIIL